MSKLLLGTPVASSGHGDRWRTLAGTAFLAAAGMFIGAGPAHATYESPDIVTTVVPVPANATLSTAAQTTWASYLVTLTHNHEYEQLRPVFFKAKTVVVDAYGTPIPGQAAEFDATSLPAGCRAIPSSPAPAVLTYPPTPAMPPRLICKFPDGLLYPYAQKIFSVVVRTPLEGAKIKFVSRTAWREDDEIEGTRAVRAFTTLSAPNPLAVNSYVRAGGGTLFTGVDGGVANPVDTWATTTTLPNTAPATSAEITETTSAVTCAPDLLTCNTTTLKIPGNFPGPFLMITLERDASTIGKYAKIASARIYYTPDPALYPEVKVPSCSDTSYGPLPQAGRPCCARELVYPSPSLQSYSSSYSYGPRPNWRFNCLAVDNGRYRN